MVLERRRMFVKSSVHLPSMVEVGGHLIRGDAVEVQVQLGGPLESPGAAALGAG